MTTEKMRMRDGGSVMVIEMEIQGDTVGDEQGKEGEGEGERERGRGRGR